MVGPSCWEGTLVLDLGNSWSETWYYHRFLLCHQFEIFYLVQHSRYYLCFYFLRCWCLCNTGSAHLVSSASLTTRLVATLDWWTRWREKRSVKFTSATTTYKNILQISCWLCNGCTITSQTLEATLTEWPSRWIKLDIVVLWPQLCYFHQLLDEMVT